MALAREFIIQPRPELATSLALALITASKAPILLLDEDFAIVGASRSFCGAFDIDAKGIEGTKLAALGGGEWNSPQLQSLLAATFNETVAVDAYEMELIRPGHDVACVVLNAHKLAYDEDKPLVILTVTDVTSARLSAKIKDELVQEKHILLQELQHRVANSLQIIASVLMQSARRVQSDETRTHLHDAHRRVMSIATLQKQLAVSSTEEVVLSRYFKDLCSSIGASMIDDQNRIVLTAKTDDSSATANVSVSLGLIVTELVINALKHAFPGRNRPGTIDVDYAAQGDGFTLSVADNGVGITAGEGAKTPGLGTGIVDALAKQLGAKVETKDTAPGTTVSVVRPS